MKCPKCSLVTFDHLSKCPKCGQSFRLQRRLTRLRRDPDRRIVLPGSKVTDAAPAGEQPAPAEPTARVETHRAHPVEPASPPAPAPAAPSPATAESAPPASDPLPEPVEAPVPAITATDLHDATEAIDTTSDEAEAADTAPPRRSIFAADLAPAEEEPAPAVEPEPTDRPAPADPQAADAARLKSRMIDASRRRRKDGPDLVSEAVDPALPDWYDPFSIEEEDEATATASRSRQ